MHSSYISALCQLHKWKHKFSPGSSGVGLEVASYPRGLGTRLGWGETFENGHLNQQLGRLWLNNQNVFD